MPFIDLDVADAYETSALPGQGDVNAGGGGIDTSSLTNSAVLQAYNLDPRSRAASGGQVVADSKGNIYNGATGQKVGRAVTPTLSQNANANHPLWTILLIVLALFLWKFLSKEDHEEGKIVKVSLSNMARITLMAGLGILILKWFFSVYSIASVSPTIEFL